MLTKIKNEKKPVSFLDRDGVLNVDYGYVHDINNFEWIDGSKATIKYLNELNYYVFVITNQAGLARGLYTETDVINLHKYMNKELNKINARIDDFFYSPYHPDFHDKYPSLSHLRKPNIGMLEMAERKWNIDKKNSFLIGDKKTDIICADNFGIKGYLFKGGNLLEFVKKSI